MVTLRNLILEPPHSALLMPPTMKLHYSARRRNDFGAALLPSRFYALARSTLISLLFRYPAGLIIFQLVEHQRLLDAQLFVLLAQLALSFARGV